MQRTLANGIRVVIEQRVEARTAVVATSYRASGEDELRTEAGIAALTQRSMAAGDSNLGRARDRLERVGAVLETHQTAETTTFTTLVDDRHLPLALWFSAVGMAALDVSPESFLALRGELAADIEARLHHDLRWHGGAALRSLALGWHRPGSTLARLRLEQAQAFHATYFSPGRAAVVIISPLAEDAVAALVEKTLGAVNRAAAPASRSPLSPQTTRRASSVRSDGVHRAGLAEGWAIAGASDADRAALWVASEALAGGFTSRLHQELVIQRGWAFAVRAHVGPRLFEVFVESPRHIQPADVAAVVDNEAAQLGHDAEAIASARGRVLRRLQRRLARAPSRARWLAEAALLHGDAGDVTAQLARVAQVSADDVRRVVGAQLVSDHASTVECFPAAILLNLRELAARDAAERKDRERAENEARRTRAASKKRERGAKRSSKGKRPSAKKGAPVNRPKPSAPKPSAPKPSASKPSAPKSKRRRKK